MMINQTRDTITRWFKDHLRLQLCPPTRHCIEMSQKMFIPFHKQIRAWFHHWPKLNWY